MRGRWCGLFGKHLFCVCYTRNWRDLFRKRYVLRCFECDLEIKDPCHAS